MISWNALRVTQPLGSLGTSKNDKLIIPRVIQFYFRLLFTATFHERNLTYFIESNILKTKANYVNSFILKKIARE